MKYIKKIYKRINDWIILLDQSHLGLAGILLVAVLLVPILYLQEECVFVFHDQLDETILSYVFPARYPGVKIYEQMMNGLPVEGLKPSAILFVPLYAVFSECTAFIIQYGIILVSAFGGMYACVKKIGKSSIIAFLSATVFAMIPFRPVYGLSVMGVPLLLICILNLREYSSLKKSQIFLNILGIIYFGLTANLVLIGYVMLILITIYYFWELIVQKKNDKALLVAGGVLLLVYGILNLDLVLQLFAEKKYPSHREEYFLYGIPFWDSVKEGFKTGIFHAYSYHKYMWVPILIAVILLFIYRKKQREIVDCLKVIIKLFLLIVFLILISSFLAGEWVADLKNQIGGMIKSFQFERFTWALPAAWHLLFGMALTGIFYIIKKKSAFLGIICIVVLYMPTLLFVAKNSIFYQNINQINNGYTTGYMTWEGIYAEDVMQEIDHHIGRDKKDYRVASLGICPVVSLMHGFYTIDGYSNNYALEYKHEFREILEGEIEKNSSIEAYYDNWGSRCYLFYSGWGTSYTIPKNSNIQIDRLYLDIEKMREMGCEYLFSVAEILCDEELGLELEGSFESETSWWKIWVYHL